ncbi:unnamed protein product [Adineta steineri]|uniref:Uncharacterized protein n=2 Tax=Adineta steineri TaxID=433720 RepID=A0A815DP53_9BILA|nr:unnamed protein product [Adineta steineri]CAF1300088.1 unnamed protein product [Adineta steineri]CAF3587781.1 unnamed protein product [Adineta steineri]CAF3686093.1 unnamed protein product [Adineta steineri]
MKVNSLTHKFTSLPSQLPILYLKLLLRLFLRRLFPAILLIVSLYFFTANTKKKEYEQSTQPTITTTVCLSDCDFIPSTDEFIRTYTPKTLLGTKNDTTRVEPTVERIRLLLEKVRSKEDKYQSLLDTFDVFNMTNPNISFKPYLFGSNVDEIKILYNRYIKLMNDNKTIQIDETFIDYLRKISSYLSDSLKNQRTNIFPVKCSRKPVFVLASDGGFFDGLQGAIHTLDTFWPNYTIIVYDMGYSPAQQNLLKTKCKQCTVIQFPFASIEKVAPHIRTLGNYAFKPFVVQDALRRYGQIIYGDSSARFNHNSFDPVLHDNYIRGFAARELPGHFLPCYTRSGAFSYFNQSYTNYNDIYMAEANFLVVTDTFLTRLIMKAWLMCALDTDCLITEGTKALCSRTSAGVHRYDQSAMVLILTHFFFQGNRLGWLNGNANDPTPYDMFTSVIKHLGDIKRGEREPNYLSEKKIP